MHLPHTRMHAPHAAVLTVGFAEDDVSVKENDSRVKIALITQGVVSEPVTIEIVPMSPAETHSNREAATPSKIYLYTSYKNVRSSQ